MPPDHAKMLYASLCWAALVAASLFLLSSHANAQGAGQVMNPAVLNTFVTAGGTKLYTGPGINPLTGRTWANAAGGAVAVLENGSLGSGGMRGGAVAAQVGRVVSGANLMRAAIVYGTWDQAVGFGDVINEWLGQSRCVPLRIGETEAGLCDPGAAPAPGGGAGTSPTSGHWCDFSPRVASADCTNAEAEATLKYFQPQYTYVFQTKGTYYESDGVTPKGYQWLFYAYDANGLLWSTTSYLSAYFTSTGPPSSGGCPAITDPYYVGYNTTANSQPGPDGKCRTGVYTPNPYADMADRIRDYGDPTKAKDVAKDLVDNKGGKLDADPGSLTGPGTKTDSPTSSTNTNPDGSKTVSTTTNTHNYNYSPTNVTVTTTTTTVNNHYDAAGNPTGTDTDTSTEAPTEEETAPPTDPEMPAIPKLYDRKYPDGIEGAWNTRSVAFKQTPMFTFLASLAPSGMNSGACPAGWVLPSGDLLGIQQGGTLEVPCYVWGFIKIVMMIGALLLARRLIFGG